MTTTKRSRTLPSQLTPIDFAFVGLVALVFLAILTGFGYAIASEIRTANAEDARLDAAVAELKTVYGAEVLFPEDLRVGRTTTGMLVRLPSGLTRCDISIPRRDVLTALLCGTKMTEPPRR